LCLAGALIGFVTAATPASETKLTGVLIDELCSHKAKTRVVSGRQGPHLEGGIVVAYVHKKECALMTECRRSGYGVFTYDHEFVPFDDEGNRMALAYFEESAQEDNFRVAVTGEMEDGVMKVARIEPLK
jgi:hypothetical protein